MKVLVFVLTLSTALTSFAADLKAEAILDFRSTYGGFNSGLYQVTTEIVANTAPSEAVLTQSQHRDDGEVFCVSTLSYEVGVIKTTIKDLVTGISFSRVQTLKATTSIQDEDMTCTTTADSFVGEKVLYVSTTGTPYALPVAAPKGYDSVQVWLSPLQTLTVKTTVAKAGAVLKLQPQGLFSAETLFAPGSHNQLVLNYYLTAVQGSTTLSLAVGVTPMTLVK